MGNWNNLDAKEKDELLSQVKAAAKDGAREGAKEIKVRGGSGGKIVSFFQLLILIAVIGFVLFTVWKINKNLSSFKDQFGFESSAESHDLVLEDQGFLGYTAADFAEAVLGEESKLCKIEVLQQEVSDVATLIDTGLGNWKMFSKTQLITYHGTAIYTVDLSKLAKSDFVLDEDNKEITVYIPHAQLEPINIQSDQIEFGDVSKGLLAFGDIDITPEQMAEVQSTAQDKMVEKLKELQIINDADRFAKMVVWEMYQPIINSVEKGYSLKVEFK